VKAQEVSKGYIVIKKRSKTCITTLVRVISCGGLNIFSTRTSWLSVKSTLIDWSRILLQNGRIREAQDISLMGFEGRAASLCDGNGWVSNIVSPLPRKHKPDNSSEKNKARGCKHKGPGKEPSTLT